MKKYLDLIFDLLIIIFSYYISYFIRFYPDLLSHSYYLNFIYFLIFSINYIFVFYISGVYKILWKYCSFSDLIKLSVVNLISFCLIFILLKIINIGFSQPQIFLTFFLILFFTILYRIFYRLKKFSKVRNVNKIFLDTDKKVNTLIIGAGEAGRIILNEYIKFGLQKHIIGFLDDDPSKKGKIISGKKIFGSIDLIKKIVDKFIVEKIIIAIPSANSYQINRIVDRIKEIDKRNIIDIQVLPHLLELNDKRPLIKELRNIDLSDLIGREEVRIDEIKLKSFYKGKKILITGAGGSIGSEITKQLINFEPELIIATGRGEYSIYNLIKNISEFLSKRELSDFASKIIYKIIDIKDKELFDKIFCHYKPDLVFHAAAHKHVPLMELNEYEAINNNLFGTLNILELCYKYNVEKFIFVSTDKAVNPENIMGATKRLGEILTYGFFYRYGIKTSIVRFGNVIGSRGSVLPLFIEQIERGGPVTVTHPEITRFFMTIPEASLLLINAASFNDNGSIYVLDMGKQFKVVDIAKELIKLYGFIPDKDIKIVYTGLRPGEKMYEELFFDKDKVEKTEHEKIFRVDEDKEEVLKAFSKLIQIKINDILDMNREELRKWLKELIPEANLKIYNEQKFVN
ncbi:MAG: polysaccharide biosynthesis protein [Spirochaetes bacterium]|nr:polysaccharide biosynthesis protein [Spirochaetota bacterium]